MQDVYTSENYIARVREAFASSIAVGELRLGETEFASYHFGNFVVELNGASVCIRVVRDRMQFLVDFSSPAIDDWIDDETVWHLIGADDVNEQRSKVDLRSLDQVAEATAAHFPAICALFHETEAAQTLRSANSYRRDRAKRLFGYDPPPALDGG